jgi:hypothetical protein
MAIHSLTIGIDGSDIIQTKTISTTDGGVVLLDAETVIVAENKQLAFSLDVSQVASFYLESSLAVLIETNSGSSPDDTLNLIANEPYIWHTNSLDTFKFASADITSLFVTNAAGATATLYCAVLYDPAL